MSYDRIVSAALAETKSKFALAEALALDIPPQRGRDADTYRRLADAREAIVAAGGEDRDVETLANYRRTAQWVMLATSPGFRWFPGTSFSAHNEARRVGMSYKDFAALPSKSVEAIRRETGHASADGPPETIVRNWTPEQRAIAARELLTDPEVADIIDTEMGRQPTPAQVADQIAADPAARSAAREAITRHDQQQRDRAHPGDSGDEPASPLSLVWEFRQLHRTIDRIATEVSKRGAIVGAAERDALMEEVAWLRSALGMIEDGIRGGSVDDALARILAGEA